MEYTENVQEAAQITRMVLPTLSRLQLPVNPINYALVYEYYLGRDEELNAELDEILNGRRPYEERNAKELFLRYVVNPGAEKMEKMGDEVRRLLADITVMMAEAGNDVSTYGDALGHSKDKLESDTSLNEVQLVVSSLLKETTTMMETNKRFENQLQETTEEMSLLRQELSEMRQQASMDSLTGLANRKTFDTTLQRAIESAANEDKNLCLMMLDIDHFKKTNDQHGHLIGDKVLKYVAATLKKMVKGKDLVARYGGEEFSIILEDTPATGALALAENIRVAIEQSRLKRTDTDESLGVITISIGLASMRAGDGNEDLIARADTALYGSKNKGRNKVTLFSDM
jgi:diguanylate cyclase